MNPLQVRGPSQRGSVAVEFALVVPIFLATVAAIVYLGLALYTKMVVAEAASTAVRTCVIQQVGWRSESAFLNCASTTFTQLTGSGGAIPVLCNGAAPQVAARTQNASYGALGDKVKMISLNISCQVPLSSMMWMSGSGGGKASSLALQIAAAMPYSLTQQTN